MYPHITLLTYYMSRYNPLVIVHVYVCRVDDSIRLCSAVSSMRLTRRKAT